MRQVFLDGASILISQDIYEQQLLCNFFPFFFFFFLLFHSKYRNWRFDPGDQGNPSKRNLRPWRMRRINSWCVFISPPQTTPDLHFRGERRKEKKSASVFLFFFPNPRRFIWVQRGSQQGCETREGGWVRKKRQKPHCCFQMNRGTQMTSDAHI